ncbi:MAG: hypothetical protein HQ557_04825 [Bacteroidetes bacterium]|nr:hypothetical protein [Bacteroidota bacterium]
MLLLKSILRGLAGAFIITVLTAAAIFIQGITIKTYSIFFYIPAGVLSIVTLIILASSKGDSRLITFFEKQRETQREKYKTVVDRLIIRRKAAGIMLLIALLLTVGGLVLSLWLGI